jgi:hypothetical protein
MIVHVFCMVDRKHIKGTVKEICASVGHTRCAPKSYCALMKTKLRKFRVLATMFGR